MWVSSAHKGRSIRVTFKNYFNTCILNFGNLWWLSLLNFSVLTCESDSCIIQFLNELNLSKINWLRGVILLIPIVLVPWGTFPLCHTPIRPILAFQNQISILIVGCVTTWSRDLHQLVSELDSINQVISFWNFRFLLFPQNFLIVQFLLLLDFAAYKKIKKIVISFCYCPKYISSIKKWRKQKKIVQKDIYWFLPQKTKQGKFDELNSELAQSW